MHAVRRHPRRGGERGDALLLPLGHVDHDDVESGGSRRAEARREPVGGGGAARHHQVPGGQLQLAAAGVRVRGHGEAVGLGAGDHADPLAEPRVDLQPLGHRVSRHDHRVRVARGAAQQAPLGHRDGARQLVGRLPGAQVPQGHDGLVVVVHAVVPHERGQQGRRVDHPPADTGHHAELPCGGGLAAAEREAAAGGDARDGGQRARGSDRLDRAARRRRLGERRRQAARRHREVGVGGGDELVEHDAKGDRHASNLSQPAREEARADRPTARGSRSPPRGAASPRSARGSPGSRDSRGRARSAAPAPPW